MFFCLKILYPVTIRYLFSFSNSTSVNSIATDAAGPTSIGHGTDSLDSKIECLLRDWHHSPDLLFAIHPIDGSFLIWLIINNILCLK